MGWTIFTEELEALLSAPPDLPAGLSVVDIRLDAGWMARLSGIGIGSEDSVVPLYGVCPIPSHRGITIAARHGPAVIGQASFSFCRQGGGIAPQLDGVAVDPAFRGQGVGGQLAAAMAIIILETARRGMVRAPDLPDMIDSAIGGDFNAGGEAVALRLGRLIEDGLAVLEESCVAPGMP